MLVEEMAMLGILVVINAVVDTLIVLVILSKRQERMMGVAKVENDGGEMIYAPLDPNGKPIKIPVGVKEVDGEQVVVLDYAPLAYSLPFMAADMAAMKLKMMLLGQKGQISQAIRNKALSEGDQEALFAMLPKKVQGALAIARMLGVGVNKGVPDGQVQVVNRGKAI